MSFDLCIVGAGPAGASLARLVGSRCRVLLVDTRRLDRPWPESFPDRCCGGLLAPDAQRLLARLGCSLPVSVLQDPQLFSVHAVDLHGGAARHYQRFYLNMDRARFDRWLVSLIPAAVEARFGWRVLSLERAGAEGFSVCCSNGQRRCRETCAAVIGADGPGSLVRRTFFGAAAGRWRRYVALQEWVKPGAVEACYGAYFDAEVTDFYAWSVPKGGCRVLGAALPPGCDARQRFALLRRRLHACGLADGETMHREASWITRPAGLRSPLAAGPGVALLGEAGGWISPSSAEGFSFAMAGAALLAQALAPGLAGFERRYARAVWPLRLSIGLKTLKCHAIFTPWCRRLLLRSGWSSLTCVSPAAPGS